MNAKAMLGHAGVHPASSKPILHHPSIYIAYRIPKQLNLSATGGKDGIVCGLSGMFRVTM